MAQVNAAAADGLALTRAAYTPGVPWEQQPFFQLLTRTIIPPGGASSYGKHLQPQYPDNMYSYSAQANVLLDEPSPLGFNGVGDTTSFVYG